MIYLIIINLIICLVLIATFIMHSNNYERINGTMHQINSSLRGIQDNWNYFGVLDKIQEEIEQSHFTLEKILNNKMYIEEYNNIKLNLENINSNISRILGHRVPSTTLEDIKEEIGFLSKYSNSNNVEVTDYLLDIRQTLDNNKEILKSIEGGINEIAVNSKDI